MTDGAPADLAFALQARLMQQHVDPHPLTVFLAWQADKLHAWQAD